MAFLAVDLIDSIDLLYWAEIGLVIECVRHLAAEIRREKRMHPTIDI